MERFRARAHTFDESNTFVAEDIVELCESGYLAAVAPERLGGAGLSLRDLLAAQRRLACYAPATALACNMHLVWQQVARFFLARGDASLEWVLRDGVAGEVFAFGVSEPRNDAVLLDSMSLAVPVGDGYEVSGEKIFTTLSPVWTRLGLHARLAPDAADVARGDGEETGDRLVYGFVRRQACAQPRSSGQGSVGLASGSITHPGEWDPLGMRGTQSWNTTLRDVPLRGADVICRMRSFQTDAPVVLAIFSSFSLLTASVYAGIADRALQLAKTAVNRCGVDGVPHLADPDTSERLVRQRLRHRASLDALDVLARDVDSVASRDDWFEALAACRNRVCDEAREAVDVACRLSGAAGYQASSELSRLYRDVLAGLHHPSSSRSLAKNVRASLQV